MGAAQARCKVGAEDAEAGIFFFFFSYSGFGSKISIGRWNSQVIR